MPLTEVEGTILFCSGECRVVLDRSWMPDLQLVLDCVEDLVDGKPEWGNVLCRLKGLERTRQGNRERLSLGGAAPNLGSWLR